MNDTVLKKKSDFAELMQPAFLVCVAVLLLAAGGLALTGRTTVRKEALHLRRALDLLDEKAIAPYRIMDRSRIASADVIKALGTEEYIQWSLEDTSVDAGSPVRYVMLFVTYYTGEKLDAVVHTPEACYLGGGNQPGGTYNEDIAIDGWSNGGTVKNRITVPVRCAVFSKGGTQAWETEKPFTVSYTFKVNGTYQRNRTATRAELSGMSRYAYYAKVEWQFSGFSGIDRSRVYPSKEETTKASEKLLNIVLGELEKSHWPDWDKAEETK
jgi:hypothetical protein